MAAHASRLFERVHTVELDLALARQATRRFANVANVAVHHGDSAQVLPPLLGMIDCSCVFWLDAHYSGGMTARGEKDTPILAELEAIAGHRVRPHAILIDDARVFGTDDAYPTLEQIIERLRSIDSAFKIGVAQDIIWAAPRKVLEFQWHVLPSGAVVRPSMTPPRS